MKSLISFKYDVSNNFDRDLLEAVRKWEESEMTGAKVRNPIIFMRMSRMVARMSRMVARNPIIL